MLSLRLAQFLLVGVVQRPGFLLGGIFRDIQRRYLLPLDLPGQDFPPADTQKILRRSLGQFRLRRDGAVRQRHTQHPAVIPAFHLFHPLDHIDIFRIGTEHLPQTIDRRQFTPLASVAFCQPERGGTVYPFAHPVHDGAVLQGVDAPHALIRKEAPLAGVAVMAASRLTAQYAVFRRCIVQKIQSAVLFFRQPCVVSSPGGIRAGQIQRQPGGRVGGRRCFCRRGNGGRFLRGRHTTVQRRQAAQDRQQGKDPLHGMLLSFQRLCDTVRFLPPKSSTAFPPATLLPV